MTAKERSETVELAGVMMERARWVDAELDRILREVRPFKFYESIKNALDASAQRVRPSMANYEPIRHVVEAGGKRVRPTLCLLACEAVGGEPKRALPTAAAVELIHTFTLIHDDIMDEDQLRRGRPTVAAIWGNPIAITAGDALFALAFGAITRNAEVPGVDRDTILTLLRRASETCLELYQGQTMDLLLSESDELATVEGYLEMVRLKTGVLLEFALEAGASLGGGRPDQVDAIRRFGAPLGMAFQIKDDLLGMTGAEDVTGKPRGTDIVRGKRTLIAVHALENLPKPEGRRLRAILDQPEHKTTPQDVEEAIALMTQAGSLQHAEKTAEDLVAKARTALRSLPHTEAGDALRALHHMSDFVIHRQS